MNRQKRNVRFIVDMLNSEERKTETIFILLLVTIVCATFLFQIKNPIGEILSVKSIEEVRLACEVSLIIFLIERSLRKKHLARIQLSVWEATLKSLLPEELANELTTIIREPIFREELRYFLAIGEVSGRPNLCQIKMELSYRIVNGTDIEQYHVVGNRSDKYLDVPQPEAKIWVDETPQVLKDVDEGSSVRTEITVPVSRRSSRSVRVLSYEILEVARQSNTYTILWPSVNLNISISNEYTQRIKSPKAELHHRKGVRLPQSQEPNYRLEQAILPGQGFKIRWDLREEPQAEGSVASQRTT